MGYTAEFYKGSAKEDIDENRGWLVGIFKAIGDPRHTGEVEIKYWEFGEGPTDHPDKISNIVEVTFLLAGVTCGHVNDDPFVLNAGEYVVIPPGLPNNLNLYCAEDTRGLTIKAPSDPSAKVLI